MGSRSSVREASHVRVWDGSVPVMAVLAGRNRSARQGARGHADRCRRGRGRGAIELRTQQTDTGRPSLRYDPRRTSRNATTNSQRFLVPANRCLAHPDEAGGCRYADWTGRRLRSWPAIHPALGPAGTPRASLRVGVRRRERRRGRGRRGDASPRRAARPCPILRGATSGCRRDRVARGCRGRRQRSCLREDQRDVVQ